MKRNTFFLFTSFLLALTNIVYAQNNEETWSFSTGVNIVDIRVPSNFNGIVKDYLNGSIEDLNIYGMPLRLSAEKRINKNFSVQLAGSFNKIKRGFSNNNIAPTEANFFIIDTKLKYTLANLFKKERGWFDPFAGFGAGVSFINDYPSGNDFKIGAGGGLNTWFSDNFGASFESYYHHNFNSSSSGTDFFQHAIVLTYRLFTKNTKSGKMKKKNSKDFGFTKFKDPKLIDSDNDGIKDEDDDCPNIYGEIANKGCPKNGAEVKTPKKVTEIETSDYNEAIFPHINIYFEIDSYEISIKQTIELINAIYFIKQSKARFLIEGHTDTGGRSRYNKILAKRRVNEVKKFLISKGVTKDKLVLSVVGESRANSENETEKETNRIVTISKINY